MTTELVKRAREFHPEWIFHSDERGIANGLIEEMADRIEELERERWTASGLMEEMADHIEKLEREREILKRGLHVTSGHALEARNEALEEAALIVEARGWPSERGNRIAAAVRALKDKK